MFACCGEAASQWSKASRTAVSTMRAGLDGRELVLGLALEFRLADEHRQHRRAGRHHVVGRDLRHALLLADPFGVVAQAAQERDAQAVLVRTAFRRRNRVAVGGGEAVLGRHPGDRPFERAVAAGLRDLAGEHLVGDEFLSLDVAGEIVLQPVREAEARLGRNGVGAGEKRRRAAPADLDAAEEIGLRARHLEQAPRLEVRVLAEDLRIGLEAHLGAAPVQHAADGFELRLAARPREKIWR